MPMLSPKSVMTVTIGSENTDTASVPPIINVSDHARIDTVEPPECSSSPSSESESDAWSGSGSTRTGWS